MKTKTIFLILLVSLSTKCVTLANNPVDTANQFKAVIHLTNQNTVILRCVNVNNEVVRFKVEDEENNILASKSMKVNGNIKITYNIDDLPSGKYTITVYQKNEVVVKRIIEKSLVEQTKIIF